MCEVWLHYIALLSTNTTDEAINKSKPVDENFNLLELQKSIYCYLDRSVGTTYVLNTSILGIVSVAVNKRIQL